MEKWVETFSVISSVMGFHPELLFAGAAGGWLALTYQITVADAWTFISGNTVLDNTVSGSPGTWVSEGNL